MDPSTSEMAMHMRALTRRVESLEDEARQQLSVNETLCDVEEQLSNQRSRIGLVEQRLLDIERNGQKMLECLRAVTTRDELTGLVNAFEDFSSRTTAEVSGVKMASSSLQMGLNSLHGSLHGLRG